MLNYRRMGRGEKGWKKTGNYPEMAVEAAQNRASLLPGTITLLTLHFPSLFPSFPPSSLLPSFLRSFPPISPAPPPTPTFCSRMVLPWAKCFLRERERERERERDTYIYIFFIKQVKIAVTRDTVGVLPLWTQVFLLRGWPGWESSLVHGRALPQPTLDFLR